MTSITFPRLIPTVGAMAQSFEPEEVSFLSPEAGGALGAVTAGFTRWVMRVTLNNMRFDDADIWRAWLAVQRGPQRQFIAFDIDRQHPRYHSAGRPYNPTPTSWSQSVNSDDLVILTLQGLLPGQVVSIGDYVGFVWSSSKRALVRAVETVRADASGEAAFAVEPPVPPVVPSGAAVTLRQAGCLMRLKERQLGEQGLGYFTGGSTIVAAQDLIA